MIATTTTVIATEWDYRVNELLGIPFKYRSQDIEEGLDCWGLTCLFQSKLRGIAMHTHNKLYKPQEVVNAYLLDEVKWKRIEGQPKFGDILLFYPIGTLLHIGVVLNYQWMLHTTIGLYSRPEIYRNTVWLPRLATPPYGVYRYFP